MGCCVPSCACPNFYITGEEIRNFFSKIKARIGLPGYISNCNTITVRFIF